MNGQHFSVNIFADAPPERAYSSINQVTAWWTTDLAGGTSHLNDTFTVYFGDVHVSTQKLVELIPNKKVVWLVTDSQINFVDDKQEWAGTRIVFEILSAGNGSEIRFTHEGLSPNLACFDACSNAWAGYIAGSLLPLINTGKGKPSGGNQVPDGTGSPTP